MDANQFLAEFGHIAHAPGGVARLRELGLSLAIQGKLVNQRTTDEPAEILLERIKSDKKPLGKRKSKKIAEISINDMPFNLPHGWVWTRLGIIAEINGGFAFKSDMYSSKGVRVVRISDFDEYGFKDGRIVRHPFSEEISGFNLEVDNILMAMTGGTVGKSFLVKVLPEPMVVNQRVATIKISTGVSPEYVNALIRTNLIQSVINAAKNSTNDNISMRDIMEFVVPLPPTEEQSRIVTKVDELMALCDQLEAQQQLRRTLQNHLRQATLQAVAASQSPRELQDSWQRLQANFGQLFSAPEDVEDLRKLLSELAIYGALDASDLPTHISVLDSYLKSLACIKSGKRFAKINQVNEEVSLPSGWRWVLLEDLLAGSESGWSPKCEAEQRRGDEWGVLKVSAVTWGEFKADENKRLPLFLEARPECEVKPGDFMLSRANTAELVARSVIAPEDCPNKLLMSDKIVRLSFLDDRLKPWVNLVNNSEYARAYYKERATGTSDSMRNVSRQVIHELPIPLPPLEVQERIFKSLADLLAICDSLEIKSKTRLDLAKNLAEASISKLTGIAIEQEEEPMKAPQTELVAPVHLGTPPDVKAQAPLATILARHNGEMSAKDLWQRFGGEIDAFYAQLKTEVAHGWLLEPAPAEMREKA